MRKMFVVLFCLNLAGGLLLSACNSMKVETQVTETATLSPTIEDSTAVTVTAAKPTSTKTAKPTQTKTIPAKTVSKTATPTITGTIETDDLATEIDDIFESLFADLEDTELILETEIP